MVETYIWIPQQWYFLGQQISHFHNHSWEILLLAVERDSVNGQPSISDTSCDKRRVNRFVLSGYGSCLVPAAYSLTGKFRPAERCNDFLTVTSLVSQKLSHPWLRGSQRPDEKTLSTFPSPSLGLMAVGLSYSSNPIVMAISLQRLPRNDHTSGHQIRGLIQRYRLLSWD